MPVKTQLHIALIVLVVIGTQGCIYKYGSAPGEFAAPNSHWSYSFAGLNWNGTNPATGLPWICLTGMQQSPINVASTASLRQVPTAAALQANLGTMKSNGSNIEVLNNGHTIQVEWLMPWQPSLTVALPGIPAMGPLMRALLTPNYPSPLSLVNLTPLQFHFHTHSEHLINGTSYALEAHIVTRATGLSNCPSTGCLAVLGVLFQVDPDNNIDHPFLAPIWNAMPEFEGNMNYLPAGVTLDFSQLLPSNRSYITYAGSLTTPPCTEGVLWTVFLTTQTMSLSQFEAFLQATGDNMCVPSGTEMPSITQVRRSLHSHEHSLLERTGSRHNHDKEPLEQTGGHHHHEDGSIERIESRHDNDDEPLEQHDSWVAERSLISSDMEEFNGTMTCLKLGAGQNYRIVQPLKQRALLIYVDNSGSEGGDGGSDGVVIAAVVIGSILGLAVLGGIAYWFMRKMSAKKKQKFWAMSEEEARTGDARFEATFKGASETQGFTSFGRL